MRFSSELLCIIQIVCVRRVTVGYLETEKSILAKPKMSIPFSGSWSRSGGISSAISKQLRTVTLKPVKRIVFKFDPFHQNVLSIR